MSALLTPAQVRLRLATGLSDAELEGIIDDEEAQLIERCGVHPDGVTAISETVRPDGTQVFLRYPIVAIQTITERTAGSTTSTTISSTHYDVDSGAGIVERLGSPWAAVVTVTYIPRDHRARRRRIVIELIRLALEQTAMQSESVAGEYSYSAPQWEERRASLYRQAGMMEI